MKRDFLAISDLSAPEVSALLKQAAKFKSSFPYARRLKPFKAVLLFEKPSLRTRASFEFAIHELGGTSICLHDFEVKLGQRETHADAARVLSQYANLIVMRTGPHEHLRTIAEHATAPVINALSNLYHPCQVLSDIFTIQEVRGVLEGTAVAFIGDGNNVANSWLDAARLVALDLRIASPHGCEPNADVLDAARRAGVSRVKLTTDPAEAASGAEVIYTDVWVSMGQEAQAAKKRKLLEAYQVNEKLLSRAKPSCIVMHCMPARRGQEITSGVLDGPRSVVVQQAGNRLHVQKAIIAKILAER